MYDICFLFFMFYFYSIFGWLIECAFCSIQEKKLVYNRGFLIGTYCPIYGFGAIYMYFFLNRYYDDTITLFVMAVVGTSIIEYITSYIMEKLFKARWWDYSNEKFNIEGRICLKNAILFGILGLAFVYLVSPTFLFVFRKVPKLIMIIVSILLFVTFLIDNILSFSIMNKLKKKLSNIKKDSTSDIDIEVRKILSSNNFYLKKLFNSFPNVKLTIPLGDKIVSSIKNTLDGIDKLRKERRKKLKEIKRELKKNRK